MEKLKLRALKQGINMHAIRLVVNMGLNKAFYNACMLVEIASFWRAWCAALKRYIRVFCT